MKPKTLIHVLLLTLAIQTHAHSDPVKIWQWAPPGPHHAAVVFVRTHDQFMGTGTLIYSNPEFTKGYVITAAHVAGGNTLLTAEWRESNKGYKSSGRVVYSDTNSDIALFEVDPPDNATFIPVSPIAPPTGSRVECIGLGSPRSTLRPYYGLVGQVNPDSTTIKTHVTHGDSGGPILYRGKVVGTVIGGVNTAYRADGFNVYYPMVVSNYTAIRHATDIWVPDT